MKKLSFIVVLLVLIASTLFGQDPSIDKGTGWIYFSDYPTLTLNLTNNPRASEIATNLNGPTGTPVSFFWNRNTNNWERWYKFDQGSGAPLAPGAQSMNAYLDQDSGLWYRWDGSQWLVNSTLSQEEVEDIVGAMFTGGTTSGININYDDPNGVFNVTVTGGGGGSTVDSLSELGDVSIVNPVDSAIIFWDNGIGKWRNDVSLSDVFAQVGGITAVTSDVTLSGDGTGGSPLSIAQQGATSGQVLSWDGSTWAPADDQTSDGDTSSINELQYLTLNTAGTSNQIIIGTLSTPTDTITIDVDDGDSDATNERITAFGLLGDSVFVTDAGGTYYADLSGFSPSGLSGDTSATNELQTIDQFALNVSNSLELSLSDDPIVNTVSLSSLEESQEIADTAFVLRALIPSEISDLSDVNTSGANVDDVLRWNGTNWYADTESGSGSTAVLSFASPILSIVGSNQVDLSAINTNLSDEEVEDIIGLMVSGNSTSGINVNYDDVNGKLDFIVTGGGGSAVDSLIELGDVAITSPVDSALLIYDQSLGKWIDGPSLSDISSGGGGSGTDDQQIDNFSISSNVLTLEIENDGQAPQTVSLAPYLDNTDEQTLSFATPNLTITGGNSVDISGIDTQLSEEQVEDFVGGMTFLNTETLITVTYQDADGTIDYEVEPNLSNYTNDAGFLTAEVDGSITNEGSLSVGAGAANSSLISSNTSGSADITIQGGTDIQVTESGNTITITSTASGGGGGSTVVQGRRVVFAGIGNSILWNSTDSTWAPSLRFNQRAFAYDYRRDSLGYMVTENTQNGGAPINVIPQYIGVGDGDGIDRVQSNPNYFEQVVHNYLDANPYDTAYVIGMGRGGRSLSDSLIAATYYRDSVISFLDEARVASSAYNNIDYFILGGYPGEGEQLESVVLDFKYLMDSLGYTDKGTTWFMNDAPTFYTQGGRWNSQVFEIVSNNGQFRTAFMYQDSVAASFDGVHPNVADIIDAGKSAYKSIFEGRDNAEFAEVNWKLNSGQDLSGSDYDGWVLTIDSLTNEVRLAPAPGAGGGMTSFVWSGESITNGQTVTLSGGDGIATDESGVREIEILIDDSALAANEVVMWNGSGWQPSGMRTDVDTVKFIGALANVQSANSGDWIWETGGDIDFNNSGEFYIKGLEEDNTAASVLAIVGDSIVTRTVASIGGGGSSPWTLTADTISTNDKHVRIGPGTWVSDAALMVDGYSSGEFTAVFNSPETGNAKQHSAFFFPDWNLSNQNYGYIAIGRQDAVNEHMRLGVVQTASLTDGMRLYISNSGGSFMSYIQDDGLYRLHRYGTGAFEDSDLGLTENGFVAAFATDGTILKKPFSELTGASSDNVYTADGTLTGDRVISTGGFDFSVVDDDFTMGYMDDIGDPFFYDGYGIRTTATEVKAEVGTSNVIGNVNSFMFSEDSTSAGNSNDYVYTRVNSNPNLINVTFENVTNAETNEIRISEVGMYLDVEVGNLFIENTPTDNTTNNILTVDGFDRVRIREVSSLPGGGSADNLGDHTATTTLNLSAENIDSIGIAIWNDTDGAGDAWNVYERTAFGVYDAGALHFQLSGSSLPVFAIEKDGEIKINTSPTINNSNTSVLVYNAVTRALELNTTISGGGGGLTYEFREGATVGDATSYVEFFRDTIDAGDFTTASLEKYYLDGLVRIQNEASTEFIDFRLEIDDGSTTQTIAENNNSIRLQAGNDFYSRFEAFVMPDPANAEGLLGMVSIGIEAGTFVASGAGIVVDDKEGELILIFSHRYTNDEGDTGFTVLNTQATIEK